MKNQKKSPFQFLDAYTVEQKDAFFGRDTEIEALYDMVFKTPLVLIYGLSGTGKTSLILCGLAGRFEGPDWYPFLIRRNDDINISTSHALDIALQGKDMGDLVSNIAYITKRYSRPVYLIFDQFEELFIMGSDEEQATFMEAIQTLISADLSTKVLFVVREEYLGQLYPFERTIPALLDFRLRVERMGPKGIKNVIQSSFDKYDIHLQPKEEADDLMSLMIKNIGDKNQIVSLPYLQVYLDQLYQKDYLETHGHPFNGIKPLEITSEEIQAFGEIKDVLDRFLDDQELEIQTFLSENHDDFPDNGVGQILDAFATGEGTKIPVRYKLEQDRYVVHNAEVAKKLAKFGPKAIAAAFAALDRSRILRISEDSIELAHDSLAQLINKKRTSQQRQLIEVRKRLMNSYTEYEASKQFLNRKQHAEFSGFLSLLDVDQHVLNFVDASQKEFIKQERREIEVEAEKKRAQLMADKAEMEQEKIKAVKEKLQAEQAVVTAQKKSRVRLYGLLASLAIIALLASVAALNFSEKRELEEAARLTAEGEAETAIAERDQISRLKDSISDISKERQQLIAVIENQMQSLDDVAEGRDPDVYQVVSTVISIKGLLDGDASIDIENKARHAFINDKKHFFTTGQRSLPSRGRLPTAKTNFGNREPIFVYAGIRSTVTEDVKFELRQPDGSLISFEESLEVKRNTSNVGYRVLAPIRARFRNQAGEYTVVLRNGTGYIIGETKFTVE
ncbi:MAG: hypothetical protein HKN87_21635 [Saprospiraceae bacterium]|nr:hypothetical protein [Saprospiraceae bacterium]